MPSTDIQEVGDHVYNVASSSSHGSFYTVSTIPGQPKTCTCTGYATKRNKNKRAAEDAGKARPGTEKYGAIEGQCRHLTQVLAYESQKEGEEALKVRAQFELLQIGKGLKADLLELEEEL